MNLISTPKSISVNNETKSEKLENQPSERVIRSILNYSRSLEIRKTSGSLTIEHLLN